MTIEAMKQALEAMGLIGADLICEVAHHAKKDRHELGEPCFIKQRWHEAFDTLRTAIEQTEKRHWVYLTNEEVSQVAKTDLQGAFVRLIEAKVREKNT